MYISDTHFNSLNSKLHNLFTLINTMCMWGCMCIVGNFCKLTAELGNRLLGWAIGVPYIIMIMATDSN